MEKTIKWLPYAVECIDRICLFLAAKSPAAADQLDDAFIATASILTTFPEAGPIEPCLEQEPEGFRYLVVSNHYKLIYCLKDDCIEIVAAWDCRQNPYHFGHLFH